MLLAQSGTFKLSDVFKVCRDLQVPKSPPSDGIDEAIIEHATELRALLQCLATLKVSRQEIEKVKIRKLASSLREYNQSSSEDKQQQALASKSQATVQLESILDSDESLETKALRVWDVATQINPETFSHDAQRSILCESPSQSRQLRLRAYQLWDTYTYKELSILSEACEDVATMKQYFYKSSFVKLILAQPHRWMSWSLQTASFQAMVRLYTIGLKLAYQLSILDNFDDAFRVLNLLELPSHPPKALNSHCRKFYDFAHPLRTETNKLISEKCRSYFQSLFRKFLQSLGGSHVLLRLQTSRKIKIEGPAECLSEFEALAKETRSSLQQAPADLIEAIWLSYVRGFEASTLKSAQEIRTQFESSRKIGSWEESPIQQLLLNAKSVRTILMQQCPSKTTEIFGVVDSLIQKLLSMK